MSKYVKYKWFTVQEEVKQYKKVEIDIGQKYIKMCVYLSGFDIC